MTRNGLFGFASLAVITAYFSARPIDDVDVLTQIRLGEILLRDGLPHYEPLSATLEGAPYVPLGWLAQAFFALLYQTVGFDGIRIVRGFVYAAALLLMVRAPIGKYHPSLFASALALAVSAIAMVPSANTRPQMVAALCFALLFRLFFWTKPLRTRAITALTLGVIWQNSHPSLATGIALAGLLTVSALFEQRGRRWGIALERLALTGILATCQLLTPLGIQVFAIAQANLLISTHYAFASEWFPAWVNQPYEAHLPFWILLCISLLLLVRYKRNVLPTQLVLFLAATAATLLWSRFVLFWGLLLAPLWASWLSSSDESEDLRPLASGAIALSALVFLALPFIALQVSPTLPPSQFPVVLVETLRQELPTGRIYNHRSFAGVFHLLGNPNWRLTSDGRLYLFPPEYWIDLQHEAQGSVAIDTMIERYHVSAFVLKIPEQKPLLDLLVQSPDWQVRESTDNAILVTHRR